MKRLVAAIVILAVSVGFSAFGTKYINDSLNDILSALEQDEHIAETWNEKKEKMAVLLKHEDIDAVDEEITAMELYRKNGKEEDAKDCATRAESYIRGIIDGEKLNLGNVF